MPNIINEITSGTIVPFADNDALKGLATILGNQLVTGDAGPLPMLVQLSMGLNPIYLGVLFLILTYIGVGGLIKTAMDGEFLGRQWHSFGVPAMFMACVVLLSPVPSKGGVTLGQVIFVRGVVYGSNFADYALREVFRLSVAQEYATTPINISTVAQNIGQINTQLRSSLPMYVCAEQITYMGYGNRSDYFFLLTDVCGIPANLIGRYADYFTQGNDGFVKDRNAQLKAISDSTGVDLSATNLKLVTGIAGIKAYDQTAGTSNQMRCQFNAFENNLSVSTPPAISSAIQVTKPKFAIQKADPVPLQVNTNKLPINYPELGAMWSKVLTDAYTCLQSDQLVKLQEDYKPEGSASVPWQGGWSNAALVIQDDLKSYKKAISGTALEFNSGVTKAVDVSTLGTTLMDKKNQAIITLQIQDLQKFTNEQNGVLSRVTLGLQGMYSSAKRFASPPDADYARLATSALIIQQMGRTSVTEASEAWRLAKNARPPADLFEKFLASTVGKIGTTGAGGVQKVGSFAMGTMTKYAGRLMAMIGGALDKKEKLDAVAESAKGAVGGLGNLITAGVKLTEMVLPGPTTLVILSVALIVMNTVVLLPQVILLVVLLMWLVKVTVWYMIIPIATVLIALPDTQVGHGIWKSSIGIMLTPFFALVFYLLSLNLTDLMYSTVLGWVFAPILQAWSSSSSVAGGIGSVVFTLIEQILTSEIVFRIFIGVAVACASTLYLCMMIIRGPDLVNRALGLQTSSGELGDELNSLTSKLDPTKRFTTV